MRMVSVLCMSWTVVEMCEKYFLFCSVYGDLSFVLLCSFFFMFLFHFDWYTQTKKNVSCFTWKTVTNAHNNESKFFLSHCASSSSLLLLSQNLQPNRFIPRILYFTKIHSTHSFRHWLVGWLVDVCGWWGVCCWSCEEQIDVGYIDIIHII